MIYKAHHISLLLIILLYIPQNSAATGTEEQTTHTNSINNSRESIPLITNAQIKTSANKTTSSQHSTHSHLIRDIKYPSSMASDGRFYYISSTPPLNIDDSRATPLNKPPRHNAKIAKLKQDGTVINTHFAPRDERLKAIGGMVVIGHNIYASDTDRLLAMNVQTGKLRFTISFKAEGTQSLGGMAKKNEHELFVTSSDTGQIFLVNLQKRTYVSLRLTHKLRQPKGLAYDPSNNELFVTEFGETHAKGRVLKITPHLYQTSPVQVLGNKPSFRGNFDAISKVDDQLFVSDWFEGNHSGKIHQLNLNNGIHTTLPMRSLRGPSGLLLDTSAHWWISATLDHLIVITPATTLSLQNQEAPKVADK